MPKELNVKRESLAERCEICHQSDQFDPTTNCCSRCELVPLDPDQSGSESELNPQDFKKWATGCAPIVISMLAGIFSSILFVSLFSFLLVGTRSRNKLGIIILGLSVAVVPVSFVVALFISEQGIVRAQTRAKANNEKLTQKNIIRSIIFLTVLVNLGIWLLLLSTCGGIIW